MGNKKIRIAWIVPNMLLYVLLIGLIWFTVINAEGLLEIKSFVYFVVMILLLGVVNIAGSFRICGWVKDGKL